MQLLEMVTRTFPHITHKHRMRVQQICWLHCPPQQLKRVEDAWPDERAGVQAADNEE